MSSNDCQLASMHHEKKLADYSVKNPLPYNILIGGAENKFMLET